MEQPCHSCGDTIDESNAYAIIITVPTPKNPKPEPMLFDTYECVLDWALTEIQAICAAPREV